MNREFAMPDNKQMLRDIEAEVQYTHNLIGRSAFDSRVMQAMREVPRHEFVPIGARHEAYYNGPLPIGHGQTISQPYIVALMTDLLEPAADAVVLEIGTGSGYQAAILSRVVKQVYSLEIIEALSLRAAETLKRLGYDNVQCRAGDGYDGWLEHAPYDGIIVTAASPNIPQPLVNQLKPGARLIIPIGLPYSHQELMVVEKLASGEISVSDVLGVAFVPLTRKRTD
jgi:protein-L-isoaspartate(D-aspartate) O-methyltransferase